MPVDPRQLTKETSISCVQMIYAWASALNPGQEKDDIIAALKKLAEAMCLPEEKLEPGTRSAWETRDEDAPAQPKLGARRSDEKLEPGARSVNEKLDKGTRSASEELEPGAQNVVAISESRSGRGGKPEKIEPGARSATEKVVLSTRSA